MNDKFVNMLFKIGLLLIGMAFLVVYYFHSQNGRFHKFGDDKDAPLTYQILDTRTGIVYFSVTDEPNAGLGFASMNLTNGKVRLYDVDRSGEWKFYKGRTTTPVPAPAAPNTPKQSAEDFLKEKK
jgi:hypothetical protein